MMCTACAEAESDPPCPSCYARALAAIGAHEESRNAGKMTAQYRDALGTLFGEGWKAGNAEVKRWATLMGQSVKHLP